MEMIKGNLMCLGDIGTELELRVGFQAYLSWSCLFKDDFLGMNAIMKHQKLEV